LTDERDVTSHAKTKKIIQRKTVPMLMPMFERQKKT
jgi:hypothetical protein